MEKQSQHEQLMLTQFQQQLVLSLFPEGSRVQQADYFRHEYLPCPVRVIAELPDGEEKIVVLRLVRHQEGSLIREAKLLPILADAGLPVPKVLVEPTSDPTQPDASMVAVYSFLPGYNCQELAELPERGSKRAIELVLEATEKLAEVTSVVRMQIRIDVVPERTLLDELEAFRAQAGVWMQDSQIQQVVDVLHAALLQVNDPVIFTNGDYQPANFLTDGQRITGYVDFEYASYQDYLYGFAKYPIYDLHPLHKAGIIPHLLAKKNISPSDFALRVALGCLKTLNREVSIEERNSPYCRHILHLLDKSTDRIK